MSNLMPLPDALECQAGVVAAPVLESYPARHAALGGGLLVRRALPRAGRRLVGPWCFLDHFGPLTFGEGKPMDVAPHPHIGLQTVTWLMAGEALHKDSLGHEQVIRPGQLNLMTAGVGMAHSEETPIEHSGRLHGLQLWVALPDRERHAAARFDHYAELPRAGIGASRVMVLLGALGEVRSPGRTYSELVALDIATDRDGDIDVPLDPSFEHALLLIEGRAALDDRSLDADTLYYLGSAQAESDCRSQVGRVRASWCWVASRPVKPSSCGGTSLPAHRRRSSRRATIGSEVDNSGRCTRMRARGFQPRH